MLALDLSLPRPQPLGVGDFPDALRLVVPDASESSDQPLLRAVAAYNAFVDEPTPSSLAAARAVAVSEVCLLLEVAAYVTGIEDHMPEADTLAAGLDAELLAHALLVRAASRLEVGDGDDAFALLGAAVEAARAASPTLAAQALAQQAMLLREMPNATVAPAGIAAMLEEALTLTAAVDAPLQRAEWYLQLGTVWHELAERDGRNGRHHLLTAVRAYQQALRHGLSETVLPDAFAMAHTNLALAYLAMPAADTTAKLRPALAIQSLRTALTVYQRETHPLDWARAQMHLANALVYAPSGHTEENLVQAVDLYEELLTVRDRALDPLGYARVLGNQANALAHLGVFGDAVEKLSEAHKLFHWHGEEAAAAEALAQLERITARRAELEAARTDSSPS